MANNSKFQVSGKNAAALFTLKLHRGDGMTLIAMNWRVGSPPDNFVGFAIEYKEPNGQIFFALKNRLTFADANNNTDPNKFSTLRSPIQKFRWVHFPRNANLTGEFTYRVTPVFMNNLGELSYGEFQVVEIELRRETYPNQLNVAFTRGFISSQAFVDRFEEFGSIDTLLPESADEGLTFVPTHPKTKEALAWMGFEARKEIIDLLDKAIADPQAQVRVVAYDLSESEIVKRFETLGNRLKIIIDDSPSHKKKVPNSGENQSETLLIASAGINNVKRQHMGALQHNKMIVVDSPNIKAVVFGSTNFSWRGFFVQANNAVIVTNKNAVDIAMNAFDNYWNNQTVASFGNTNSAKWQDLQLDGIKVKVAFSPHSATNALLKTVADDINDKTTSSLFYSLAFLYMTPGVIMDAINKVTNDPNIFVYGMSDKKVGGIIIQKPDGNLAPVSPSQLSGKSLPEPFKKESAGGGGVRLHHKFVVVDFNKPTARVYLGSYNFSESADNQNGENLLLIKDRRIAVSYMIEGLSLFDHYHFRANQIEAKKAKEVLSLIKPPKAGEIAWWQGDFTIGTIKSRDRLLFS
jgi:phosphatidylserine/phosphatidylglycerophosphate/cardiolipin synthase-like enzyme